MHVVSSPELQSGLGQTALRFNAPVALDEVVEVNAVDGYCTLMLQQLRMGLARPFRNRLTRDKRGVASQAIKDVVNAMRPSVRAGQTVGEGL